MGTRAILSPMTISVRSMTLAQAGGDPQLADAMALADAKGEPLQIRMQPQLYRAGERTYQGWKDTSWTVGVPTVAEAEELRDALGAFFEAVAVGELAELTATLRAWRAGR